MEQGALGVAGVRRVGMDWRWAAACVQRAGRGYIVSPRAQLVVYWLIFINAYFLHCFFQERLNVNKKVRCEYRIALKYGIFPVYLISVQIAFCSLLK